MEKTANTTTHHAMLEAGEATLKVHQTEHEPGVVSTSVELIARCELDDGPYAWGLVWPGQRRARRHRRELKEAKSFFGLTGKRGQEVWWLPVGWKDYDRWSLQDCGVSLPHFIPLKPGTATGDEPLRVNTILLPEESPVGVACTATVDIRFRWSEDVGIRSEDIPLHWAKGRRHML